MPAIVCVVIAYAEPVCWRKPVDVFNTNNISYLNANYLIFIIAKSVANISPNGICNEDGIGIAAAADGDAVRRHQPKHLA